MSLDWPLCPPDNVVIGFLGHRINVHPDAADAFRLVELRARRTRYGTWLSEQTRATTPTGGFACRNRRPFPETPVTEERHSEHCHGHTIDVNWDDNPLSTVGLLKTDFDRFGLDDGGDWLGCWLDLPPGLDAFFRWGGGWTTELKQATANLEKNRQVIREGVVDGMHFELALTPDEVRGYDWETQIREEAEVNKQLEALVAKADEIKEALTFTQELTEALKPDDQERATPGGAAKRVAKTVLKSEQEG